MIHLRHLVPIQSTTTDDEEKDCVLSVFTRWPSLILTTQSFRYILRKMVNILKLFSFLRQRIPFYRHKFYQPVPTAPVLPQNWEMCDLSTRVGPTATGLLFSGCQSNSLQRDNKNGFQGISCPPEVTLMRMNCYNPTGQRSLQPLNRKPEIFFMSLSLIIAANIKYNIVSHTKKLKYKPEKKKKPRDKHGRRIFIHELFYKQSNKQLPTCLQKNH